MLKASMKRNIKIMRIHRQHLKEKFIENEKIKKNGTNFPVDTEKLKTWKNKINRDFPFLL